ncbi:VOC family protein [Haladaptatus salinisoli]|uniref:VOC family protein n=1 Tax=Haladaptatus salinisoli TaxID=2884876 RepID=UPI001D0B9809|nr:VOC family protein [Haladaptatus salinisoli]
MITKLTYATVLVEDTDEALSWYTEKLGFEKRSDEEFAPGMRWVTVAPPDGETEFVLQEPTEEFFGEEAAALRSRIGEGTVWVLETDDCRETVAELEGRGVTVADAPEEVPWGVSAVVEDLYGNPYNLVEPR